MLTLANFGHIIKITQLVLTGVLVVKEVVDMVRNKNEQDV